MKAAVNRRLLCSSCNKEKLLQALEPIRWPEYLGCVLTFAHHVDVGTYRREGRLCCVDCRVDLSRARTWRGRLVEWGLLVALVVAVGGPLLVGAWLLR